jgi:carbon-monoxide dehydrogenase medium subunit
MKPFPFDYARPATLAEAARLLAQAGDDGRVIAGGQSLGPMLNLRLARPGLLVDIRGIPELTSVETTADTIALGACVTHAAIEDRRVPDIGKNVLPSIAAGIAYRAVRNRGTMGGSISHADPAGDWVTALTALDATVMTYRARDGGRAIPIGAFFSAAFVTALEPGEIVQALRIPRLSAAARWGWYKVCRKPGEFAVAIGAVLDDPERGVRRAVIGATDGPPILLEEMPGAADAVEAVLARRLPATDPLDRRVHGVAVRRAYASAQ